jgi:superfamily II DNA or RNA helicase/RNase H-fold protein (predicted Holliday junction resolvase)
LDKLSRNEDVRQKLKVTDWDLIVCDEAHKMSASFFGGDIKKTGRYRLGELLSTLTRHFLLLTATPHNGKEEDFQLFMALLDGDRFEGKPRDGAHTIDASDLMRRMVKEDLLKFDGHKLFPERRAYTASYRLSEGEAALYEAVTNYVREEFNRAERLADGGRKHTVGFALTVLQRRLASSPEAIYQSLHRRRERLEKRCREEELLKRGEEANITFGVKEYSDEEIEDFEDSPDGELELAEETLVDQASAARNIGELKAEIAILKNLEKQAYRVRYSNSDCKWGQLSSLLQNQTEMFDANGRRQKLIIFTEHKDTLTYLQEKIRALLGKNEAVVAIHGGMGREERKKAETLFTQDKDVEVLIATDAAGEGINLQRAHLMINYDLPWNPNRLEQRFGRIHRIGQTEICYCWNLLAKETREGDVYQRLLDKLEIEREALGGKVFDILGKLVFDGKPLRDLLRDAVRDGNSAEAKARFELVVDNAMEREKIKALIDEHSLTHDSMDVSQVMSIREDMERMEARRLQPHFIASFFREAFKREGGTLYEKEPGRFEATHVPASIRNRDRIIGTRESVPRRYERLTFDKNLVSVQGKPLAEFVCPGHPLMDALIDIVLEKNRDLLKQGAILIDENSGNDEIRVLVYLEHAIQDAATDENHQRHIVSKRVQFVEVGAEGKGKDAGDAPYLDYRPASEEEMKILNSWTKPEWTREDIEKRAKDYAVCSLVPAHLSEVKTSREEQINKTRKAVNERLQSEIRYWDHRAAELRVKEEAGKNNSRINSQKAEQRADDLSARLKKRLDELDKAKKISPLPPVVIGGALIVPGTLLHRLKGESEPTNFAANTKETELVAMNAVMDFERREGFFPQDKSSEKKGYDIESRGKSLMEPLRFIEVKGRADGSETVIVTKNEILTALNEKEQFILALVNVKDGKACELIYLKEPFGKDLDFGATCVVYNQRDLIAKSQVVAREKFGG